MTADPALRPPDPAAAHPTSVGPLPLVIGITGHLDLREPDVPALEAKVAAVFTELRARYPHTPLILLSPLAEGADRLVARVALRMDVRLSVPLPMPRAVYEEDFKTPASRAEFAELLGQAHQCFELPFRRGVDEEQVREHTERRDPQYEQVGIYIADHCHILIALWNGAPMNGSGGTGQIVQYKLEGTPRREVMHSTRSPLDPPETGPVYQIVTPRASRPETDGEPFSLRKRFPSREGHEEREEEYERIYQRIEGFNRDSLVLDARLAEKQKESKAYLLPGLNTDTLTGPIRALVDCFAVADALAIHFQRLTHHTLFGTMSVIFLMALLFDVYTELLRDKPWGHWVLLLYPIVWAAAYVVIYARANRGDYQNKYQDYRALAEGLRVQFFWSLAKLPDSVSDHYLSKQQSELDWIRKALQFWKIGAEFEDAAEASPLGGPIACLRQILDGWVADQAAYFASRAHRAHGGWSNWRRG